MHFTYTHLFVSPHQVGLGVAGVMDHHLLLPNAAVTATRGAAAVVMNEYYREEGGRNVQRPSEEEDGLIAEFSIIY